MRRWADLVPVLAVAGLHVACAAEPTAPEAGPDLAEVRSDVAYADTVVIGFGERVGVGQASVSVRYGELTYDSRCAIGLTCVWEGDAAVIVEVADGGTRLEGELHTRLDPRSMTFGEIVITLLDVRPFPVADRQVDPPETSILVEVAARGATD